MTKKKASAGRPTKTGDKLQKRSLMDFVVWDRRLKIFYFVPHAQQDLMKASPFGMYTPGLLVSHEMFLSAALSPADIREPFADPESVLHMRMRRLIWRHVIPVDINALQEVARSEIPSLFRVVLTNDAAIASEVDGLQFYDEVPFMHVSSVAGKGRVPTGEYTRDRLLVFIESVLTYLSEYSEWCAFVKAIRGLMKEEDKQPIRTLELGSSHHNLTLPNEIALLSYGWQLDRDDPLVQRKKSPVPVKAQRYIERICLIADAVSSERRKIMRDMPDDLVDSVYVITVPSVYWGHYKGWQDMGRGLEVNEQKALRLAYKTIIRQSTYFGDIQVEDAQLLLESKPFQMVMQSRAADQRCYTSGLALLSSSTLLPVIRLEPRVNKVRGDLKILAHCARHGASIHSQFKQSRLARVAGCRMRNLIDENYLERIDRKAVLTTIQGIKLVSDVPLEWLPCLGIPLGLRYDLSCIPLLPGNAFLAHCTIPPVFISQEKLFDIMVVRSFASDDYLKPMLEVAIKHVLKNIDGIRPKIKFVDVETEDELIKELSEYSGAILIFDGHGSYEDQYGVGTILIGGNPVEIWNLKGVCRFPPIVMFSACDTHPLDGSHGSCANAAFTLGATTVLATSLPINGALAAKFMGRLILRIAEFVPAALELREILTWREVISGMLRMTYVSEVTRLLVKYEHISISESACDRIQYEANTAINTRRGDWYEIYLKRFARESKIDIEELRRMILRWASITDSQKYVQLGSPENVIITGVNIDA